MKIFYIFFVSALLSSTIAKFSEWNSWSACSVQCGTGWSTRERIAKMDECYTELSERRECGSPCNYTSGNLAWNKPVTASSVFLPTFPLSNVVDGTVNTDFYGGKSCTMTDKDTDPFLMIDLLGISIIREVTVYNRGDCCQHRLNNFVVSIGNDSSGADGVLCGKGGIMESLNKTTIHCCDAIYGRYVRLHVAGPQFLSVCEIQVYGEVRRVVNGTYENLALGKRARQSPSRSSEQGAHYAVDGLYNTFSITSRGYYERQWWYVDLGRTAAIHKIRFYAADRHRQYFEQGSNITISRSPNDDFDAVLCGTLDYNEREVIGEYAVYDVTCTEKTEGRFVKVGRHASYYVRLAIRELEVYGTYV